MKTLNIKILAFIGVLVSVLPVGAMVSANIYPDPNPSCVALSRGLFLGVRDDMNGKEVAKLQAFLAAQGYFDVAASGYFGPITLSAVEHFQRDHNISAIGLVGPLTRAEIQRVSCLGITNTLQINSLSPQSGVVGTSVMLTGKGFTADNTVSFGGGVISHVASTNGTSLSFTVPYSLNPACYYSNPRCLIATRQVTPGNYDVIVSNANGTSNALSYSVTGSNGNSVSISGIDTPSQLKVGQAGSWTVHATDGSGVTNMSYSVVWGDEVNNYTYATNAASGSVSQSSTFTHTYNSTGTYTPKFTVTNNSGASATVSTSVLVTN